MRGEDLAESGGTMQWPLAGDMQPGPCTRSRPSDGPLRLSILGATGSVGTSTLDVVARAPDHAFEIVALTANNNVAELAAAARRHRAELAVIADQDCYSDLADALSGSGIEVAAGASGLLEAGERSVDCVMAAIVGAAGLQPCLNAARNARRLALANKECLVIAGDLFLDAARTAGAEIIPVDSEHAAVFQVLSSAGTDALRTIYLTASGGPFLDCDLERLETVRRADALKHPNWSMGDKITIDSATMMNKGLELIEAYHLFPVAADQLDAVIHPQSIMHCLVEYADGSLVTQMALPDMRTPIAQSLYWPDREAAPERRLKVSELGSLTFREIEEERYPAFFLAKAALRQGGAAPTVLNGANEAAVQAFLNEEIRFLDIAKTVAETLERAEQAGLTAPAADIETALEIDAAARRLARDVMGSR